MNRATPEAFPLSAQEVPPSPEPARFDPAIGSWRLSKYADVSAALCETRLVAAHAGSQGEPGAVDATAHAGFRKLAKSALPAAKVDQWLAAAAPLAGRICHGLDLNRPVDLVGELAEPWALAVAVAVTGVDTLRAEHLNNLARDVFVAASEPYDEVLQSGAARATGELAASFSDALGVQTFVALSQTLPCFLANAWLALLRHPSETGLLEAHPELMQGAVEELLRYATPSRAQFRRASRAVSINGIQIEAGQRVILLLAAANRDPEEFSEPDRLNIRRRAPHHLAFGAGGHACVGAALVRSASAVAMRTFVNYFGRARLCDSIPWRGGFAIRSPASLHVQAHTAARPESTD